MEALVFAAGGLLVLGGCFWLSDKLTRWLKG